MTDLGTPSAVASPPIADSVDFELLLVQAAAEHRTGRLVIHRDDHEVGQVFIHRGRVAWATCIDQNENLGTFLERLGHVREEQLADLRQEHARRQGACKLGDLLVETGVISPARLRSCLKLHLRMALTRLLQLPQVTAVLVVDPRSASENMSFPLRQLLPSWWRLPEREGDGGRADFACAQAACLASLSDVPGFLGALVIDRDGEVVAQCGFAGALADKAPGIVSWASAVLGEDLEPLGGAATGFVEGTWGALVARRLEDSDGVAVAVLLGPGAKPGTVLHRLSAITPALLGAAGDTQEGAS